MTMTYKVRGWRPRVRGFFICYAKRSDGGLQLRDEQAYLHWMKPVIEPLQAHLPRVKASHERDLAADI